MSIFKTPKKPKAAVLVGCNYYNNRSNKLNGCIDDIVNVKNVLTQYYEYTQDKTVMLRDDSLKNTLLLPTKDNILNHLTRLVNTSSQYSEIFFMFSGHGMQTTTEETEEDELEEVILPLDYETKGCITDSMIYEIIKHVHPSCNMILLFDSCNSGTICDLQWSLEYTTENKVVRSLRDKRVLSNKNVFCFSSCKDTQLSNDVYVSANRDYEGAFTHAFLTCLKQNKYNVAIMPLYIQIVKFMRLEGYDTQTPLLSSSSQTPEYSFETKNKMVMSRFSMFAGRNYYWL